MTDVFLSYSRSDAEQAENIIKALQSAGVAVWMDKDLRGQQ